MRDNPPVQAVWESARSRRKSRRLQKSWLRKTSRASRFLRLRPEPTPRLRPIRRSSGPGRRPTPPRSHLKKPHSHDFAVALATKWLTLTTFRLTVTTFGLLPRFYFERHDSKAGADNFPHAVRISRSSDNFDRYRANCTNAIAISSPHCRFPIQISKLPALLLVWISIFSLGGAQGLWQSGRVSRNCDQHE